MGSIEIQRNANITPEEVEELRQAIGWNPNIGKYQQVLKQSYAYFSIRNEKKLIAFARVISDGILYSFIVDLTVHSDFQRQGIGKHLVKHIITELKKDDIQYIQLTFYKELEPFYKECGFEIIEAGSIVNK